MPVTALGSEGPVVNETVFVLSKFLDQKGIT